MTGPRDHLSRAPLERCIICGFHVLHPVYAPGAHPLASVGLPRSVSEAAQAPRFELDFRACGSCGHIFNTRFCYADVPYERTSLMYNDGHSWNEYIVRLADRLINEHGAAGKTVVDLGGGDGGFLHCMVTRGAEARLLCFEPSDQVSAIEPGPVEIVNGYFDPAVHMEDLRPDFIVCRHVIEHLENPRDLIADIAYWSCRHGLSPLLVFETPASDRAIRESRIHNFFYEHMSNFTERSVRLLFELSSCEVLEIERHYNDEVFVVMARPRPTARYAELQATAAAYRGDLQQQRDNSTR